MTAYDTLTALTAEHIAAFHAEAERDRLIQAARGTGARPIGTGRAWARISWGAMRRAARSA